MIRNMIIERVEDAKYMANAYLVAEGTGGRGVLIDGNGVIDPLLGRIARDQITITHILLTHHHPDHVADLDRYRQVFPSVPVVAHPETSQELGDGAVDITLRDGDHVESGELSFKALDTPGHCQGHFAYLLNDLECFSGDLLFRRTLGGHARPGGNFPQLKGSTMDVMMHLPPSTRVYPGHRGSTTIGEEWEDNTFIRLWRGIDPPGTGRVSVVDVGDGTLLATSPDYDGGYKGLVRFDDGVEGIFFGSRLTDVR